MNVKEFTEKVEKTKFKMNEEGTNVAVSPRNKLKQNALEMLVDLFNEKFPNAQIGIVKDGTQKNVAIGFFNEEMQEDFTVLINPIIKGFDFEVAFEIEDYQNELKKKAKEEEEKEKAKQEKIKKDKAERERKKQELEEEKKRLEEEKNKKE